MAGECCCCDDGKEIILIAAVSWLLYPFSPALSRSLIPSRWAYRPSPAFPELTDGFSATEANEYRRGSAWHCSHGVVNLSSRLQVAVWPTVFHLGTIPASESFVTWRSKAYTVGLSRSGPEDVGSNRILVGSASSRSTKFAVEVRINETDIKAVHPALYCSPQPDSSPQQLDAPRPRPFLSLTFSPAYTLCRCGDYGSNGSFYRITTRPHLPFPMNLDARRLADWM